MAKREASSSRGILKYPWVASSFAKQVEEAGIVDCTMSDTEGKGWTGLTTNLLRRV